MKFAFIAAKEVAFPVVVMCRVLGVGVVPSCAGIREWWRRESYAAAHFASTTG